MLTEEIIVGKLVAKKFTKNEAIEIAAILTDKKSTAIDKAKASVNEAMKLLARHESRLFGYSETEVD